MPRKVQFNRSRYRLTGVVFSACIPTLGRTHPEGHRGHPSGDSRGVDRESGRQELIAGGDLLAGAEDQLMLAQEEVALARRDYEQARELLRAAMVAVGHEPSPPASDDAGLQQSADSARPRLRKTREKGTPRPEGLQLS